MRITITMTYRLALEHISKQWKFRSASSRINRGVLKMVASSESRAVIGDATTDEE